MTVTEEFIMLLEKEQYGPLFPFLQKLTKEDKKTLAPTLRELQREYLDFKQTATGFKQKARPLQRKILEVAAFVCLNRKDFEKYSRWSDTIITETIDQILPWYCPDWLADHINGYAKNNWLPYTLDYERILQLAEKANFQPSRELIILALPQLIFSRNAKNILYYSPENLTKRKITLDEHIWLIFELENSVCHSDTFNVDQNGPKRNWVAALKNLSLSGELDRVRLLRETVLATARNFNKVQTGWHAELFHELEPTIAEILSLQKELMTAFNSPHSKPLNMALSAFRKIVSEKEFNFDAFLDNVPLLLSSNVKSVVSSTLTLLEKAAKHFPEKKEKIAVVACQAFVSGENDLQEKAAKLIVKLAKQQDVMTETIRQYEGSLLMSARELLKPFLTADAADSNDDRSANEELNAVTVRLFENHVSDELVPVEKVETVDELIFLASQAFDNNKPYHVDLLAAAVVNLHHKIAAADVMKFEPALQRAYKIVTSDWASTMGYLDHMLATFFIDYTRLLLQQFPEEGKSLKVIHSEFEKKDKERFPLPAKSRILHIETWAMHTGEKIYELHKSILVNAFRKVARAEQLPLLSTPTHEPCLLDASALIDRLSKYQHAHKNPGSFDFQIAIARCLFREAKDALHQLPKLGGEYRSIMEFLLDRDATPQGPFTMPGVWMVAGLVKDFEKNYPEFKRFSYGLISHNQLTGQFPWRSFDEKYTYPRYNYKLRKNEDISDVRKTLRLESLTPPKGEPESGIVQLAKKLFNISTRPLRDETIFFELISLKGKYLWAEHNDIERLIYLSPNHPEPMLAQIIARSLCYNNFTSEIDRKLVTHTLEALSKFNYPLRETGHLFIATSMLSSDKTIRSFASEIWGRNVRSKTINSRRIGEILGIHQSVEFAPMKRFTDLLASNLLHFSDQHDRELEVMVNCMLVKLPKEPVTNLKKLLEVYYELVSYNKSVINEEVKRQLENWKGSASLKKIVSRMA